MQIIPDWSNVWTAEEAEKELKGFEFKGPGWYVDPDESLLVVPMVVSDHTWRQRWPKDAKFRFCHYGPFHETMFSATWPPSRKDNR